MNKETFWRRLRKQETKRSEPSKGVSFFSSKQMIWEIDSEAKFRGVNRSECIRQLIQEALDVRNGSIIVEAAE